MKRSRISSTDSISDSCSDEEEEELDRLTNLPGAIILHILSFVDSKLAVQTSVLSTRWTRLWMYVPALNFYSCKFTGRRLSFANFIPHFLKRHDAPTIHKLCFQDMYWLDESILAMVMKHAVSRHVREIHLDLIHGHSTDFLEHGTLGYKSLTTLKLEKVRITKHLNFPFLLSLTLDRVYFSCNKCYMVAEKTRLPKAVRLGSLEFPFLKTLILRNLKIGAQRKDENENHCIELFSSFVNLENLEMTECNLDHCNSFIINSPHLVNLKISKVRFTWLQEAITKLIICAPRLKSFKLETGKEIWSEFSADKSTKLRSFHLHTAEHPLLQDEKTFHKVVNIFKALNTVRSLNLTMSTIRTLSYAPDCLENETCPFDNLEICKVHTTSDDTYNKNVEIPTQVMRYLRSGSSKLKELILLFP